MSSSPGVLKRAWYRWKSLQLPWRRQRLIGVDLAGNTFWEFKDALNANRFRRIVRYGGLKHYADVHISPQWHQWLRHTRDAAPTLQEQQHELARQARMKQLASEADARWSSVESFLDPPARQQPAPAIGVKDPGGYVQRPTEPAERLGVASAVENPVPVEAAAGHGGQQQQQQQQVDEGLESRGKTKGQEQKQKKREDSPWQQKGSRGAPSENWQPESWSPGVAQRR